MDDNSQQVMDFENSFDKPVIAETNTNPDACVIVLHGLGADGFDLADIVEQMNLPEDIAWRFIFPHAPVQAVTVNGGMSMRSWYDIYSLDIAQRIDVQGIADSVLYVKYLIEQQIALGIAEQRIVLAGFSQGGLVALKSGLYLDYKIAGIVALSTYFPELCLDAEPLDKAPVFMTHGYQDTVIPYEVAEASSERLQNAGVDVEWHAYSMGHNVCLQEIHDMGAWLLARLNLQ